MEQSKVLARSPLMFRVLRLLQSGEASLMQIVRQLKKTKPSTSRALQGLLRMGLIEAKRNPENGRSMLFAVPEARRAHVRRLLVQVASAESPSRATPFMMADLDRLVEGELRSKFVRWKISKHVENIFDFVLQAPDSSIDLALVLKLGGMHFERRLFEIIGLILSVPKPPKLVVLAIFGTVTNKSMSIAEERLTTLLNMQGSTLRFLWMDRGPLALDRAYVREEVVEKILAWINYARRSALSGNA